MAKTLHLVCSSCREPITAIHADVPVEGEARHRAAPCGCGLTETEFEATEAHILQHREETDQG